MERNAGLHNGSRLSGGFSRTCAAIMPEGSLRERCFRKAAQHARRAVGRFLPRRGPDLADVLRENSNHRGIVVYPPFIDWNWMRQRPHHLMTQFAKSGYLSLFCTPQSRRDRVQGFERLDDRLYLCDSVSRLFDLPEPIVLTGWTGHAKLLERFRRPTVIYDYLDDLGVSSRGGAPDAKKVALHRKMAMQARVVLATARRLFEEIREIRPDALYCPNGADYDHFHGPAFDETAGCRGAGCQPAENAQCQSWQISNLPHKETAGCRGAGCQPAGSVQSLSRQISNLSHDLADVPSDIAAVVEGGRPIIGYYGALARWFDFDLVARAACRRPDYEFVLLGPCLDGEFARSDAARLPNVRWLGEKRYEDLPRYLRCFSVATIPFAINDVTKAVSPVKLFEYMAGGRPIVTTDMPECRGYDCVLIARDEAEYAAMLDTAIAQRQSPAYCESLDQAAKANTWAARIRQIIARLNELELSEKRRSA